jgi:glycine oxidase
LLADSPSTYRDEGTLVVALGREAVERLRFRHEHQRRAGLDTRWLSGTDIRAPGLRPSVAGGIFCQGDHQVDPRRLIPALVQALRARGGLVFQHCPVTAIETSSGQVSGLTTAAGLCRARTVIVAGGVWSADGILPRSIDIRVRPLKGQALALRTTRATGSLSHVIWTEQVRLAPKSMAS